MAEHCDEAAERRKLSYSYQAFCEMFAAEAERLGTTQHFEHEPGAKCYVDWSGDSAWLTDMMTGAKAKIWLLVVVLPLSDRFWAEGFLDMRQESWQQGQAHAFEDFGGVPRLIVPDNWATAMDRSAIYVMLLNKDYERFAEHYGAAVVPARVRKPRHKSTSESCIDLVEKWVIAPSNEMTFYTLEEFNEFCLKQVRWLDKRPFSAKDGSRDSVFEAEERPCLQPLPKEPYERCEWRSAKVAPDYHVTIDYVHYSVPCALIGRQVDVRLTASKVAIMSDGAVVAEHGRLHGRKGQCSTVVDHMPENHRLQESPWSRERFGSWARRIGPETGKAIARLLDSRPIAEQAFVSCRNMLGLSKSYSPELLERACTRANAVGAIPSYTACKNSILSIKTTDAGKRSGKARGLDQPEVPVDRAKSAGLTRGADAYRKVVKLVREARFKLPSACVEDALYLKGRKLSKNRVQRWAECDWVENREVMVVISKTGCGKSYLCQALGNAACQKLIKTRYVRLADMFDELNHSRASGDGGFYERMDAFKHVPLLIVDDFMTTPVATQNAIDLFEVMEAREGRAATLIASQLEPNEWYLGIEGGLMADSILNRFATGARYVDLDGPNMREYLAKQKADL